MKKICFVVPRYHPAVGGTEKLCQEILESLTQLYDVSLITTPHPDRNNHKYKYTIHDCVMGDDKSFKSIFLNNNFDLTIFFADLHTAYLNLYDINLCKKNICVLNLDERTYLWKDNFIRATYNLKKFDNVITFTKNGIANKYLEENNIKNIYVPNFSRDILATEKKTDFKKKLFDNNKKIILYNAALETRKNQLNVLECIAASKELKEYNWLFIGATPELPYLDKCVNLVKENNLDNIVKFLKSTTNQALLDQVYQSVDLLLLLSIAEGLPLVLLEAMSAKLPWVATPVGGIKGVLGDTKTGIVLEQINFDSKTIADAIKKAETIDINTSRDVWYNNFKKEVICSQYLNILRDYI